MQSLRSSASLDLSVLKEPRGFIRIIQLVLAIFAFATLTSVTNSCSTFRTRCPSANQTTKDVTASACYGYPFGMDGRQLTLCNGTHALMYSGSTSSAEFFCFIGVMTFLVCLAFIVLYVFFMDAYNSRTIAPKVDLIFSVTWTLLWLISSAAWADGYSRLSTYLSADGLIAEVKRFGFCKDGMTCDVLVNGDNSTLIVSVLFGFLNFLLWGASLWFLFKETEWHKARQQQQQGAAGGGSQFDQPGGVASPGQSAGPPGGPANLY